MASIKPTYATQVAALREDLPRSVSQAVRDLPYVHACSYQDEWTEAGATIIYDRLVSNFTNGYRPGGGHGNLDIKSGAFTCGTPGFYTVTFSSFALLDSEQMAEIFLFRRDEKIEESHFHSHNDKNYMMGAQGSRTLVALTCTLFKLFVSGAPPGHGRHPPAADRDRDFLLRLSPAPSLLCNLD